MLAGHWPYQVYCHAKAPFGFKLSDFLTATNVVPDVDPAIE